MTTVMLKSVLRECISKFPTGSQVRLSSNYKAAVLKEIGKPLVIDEKAPVKLGKNQVRIQVQYCSVNSVDCISFTDSSRKLPFVPGYELSGEVVEVGKGVTNEQIILGEKAAALSLEKFGGFAQQCIVGIHSSIYTTPLLVLFNIGRRRRCI